MAVLFVFTIFGLRKKKNQIDYYMGVIFGQNIDVCHYLMGWSDQGVKY